MVHVKFNDSAVGRTSLLLLIQGLSALIAQTLFSIRRMGNQEAPIHVGAFFIN